MSEKLSGEQPEEQGVEEFKEKIEYVDKKGQVHIFETTEELMQFKEGENNRDNN